MQITKICIKVSYLLNRVLLTLFCALLRRVANRLRMSFLIFSQVVTYFSFFTFIFFKTILAKGFSTLSSSSWVINCLFGHTKSRTVWRNPISRIVFLWILVATCGLLNHVLLIDSSSEEGDRVSLMLSSIHEIYVRG